MESTNNSFSPHSAAPNNTDSIFGDGEEEEKQNYSEMLEYWNQKDMMELLGFNQINVPESNHDEAIEDMLALIRDAEAVQCPYFPSLATNQPILFPCSSNFPILFYFSKTNYDDTSMSQ